MTERLLPDPELERLVAELNRGEGSPRGGGESAERERLEPFPQLTEAPGARPQLLVERREIVAAEGALEALLAEVVRRDASDLLLVAGLAPVVRVAGKLARLPLDPLPGDEILALFAPHLPEGGRAQFAAGGSLDFSLRLLPGAGETAGHRFRVNLHRQRGMPAAAARALPRGIPTLDSLSLPASLADLVRPARGLVLCCGPAGAGKTSTLAALVGEINRTRACHVLTIEDPVEYEHPSANALVEHIEIGRDARSFGEALRAALRQDPDVLLVGEMRDLETISTALTAAETGHLVLATLHSNDSVQAIHRMVDVFPAAQQAQIRQQLALALSVVVTQQLVPRADGRGRVPAIEVLLATPAVRHLIRSEQLAKLYNEIVLGKRVGMVTLEDSLAQRVRDGVVTLEEAEGRSSRPEELRALAARGLRG